MFLIGVDIGGSHVGLGLIDAKSLEMITACALDINGKEIITSELIQVIVDGCRQLLQQASKSLSQVVAIGMGCPGQVNNNILITAANFPKLSDAPLAQLVSSALGGVHTKLINDADAAMSAEVWGNPAVYGKYQHVAMVTLGTGVGFGLILNGRLHQGASGLIEGGHMIVVSSGDARVCGCGQKGCVEAYASAKNTVLRMQECDAIDRQESSSSPSSQHVDGKTVFERYAMNDFNAVKVVEETGEYLALMVLNICRVVDPEIIVFGGGLSKAGKPLLDVIKKHLKQRTWKLPTDVKLALALTEENGVIGAALAVKSELSAFILENAVPSSTASSQATPIPSPSVSSFSDAHAVGGDHNKKKKTNKKRQSNGVPSWVGAFFALSSVTLFTLDIVQSALGSTRNSNNLHSEGGWRGSPLVSWLTRGLLAGQVSVGAYALHLCLKEDPHVEEHKS